MNIKINPFTLFKSLTLIILILLFANILGAISKLYFKHDFAFGLIPLFDFNAESNIPTLFSSTILIIASALLFLISSIKKNTNHPYSAWVVLAIIFLFLSIDETSSLHEKLTIPLKSSLNTSGLLFYAWVIPYGLALLIFIASYTTFLFHLPQKTRNLFILSGLTFVIGAIGFELLGGMQDEAHGQYNLTYILYYSCEELLEMLGVSIFIYTLASYINDHLPSTTFTLTRS